MAGRFLTALAPAIFAFRDEFFPGLFYFGFKAGQNNFGFLPEILVYLLPCFGLFFRIGFLRLSCSFFGFFIFRAVGFFIGCNLFGRAALVFYARFLRNLRCFNWHRQLFRRRNRQWPGNLHR